MEVSINKHVHLAVVLRRDGRELNPHLPGFGDRAPIRWLIPREKKAALRFSSRGGCLVAA